MIVARWVKLLSAAVAGCAIVGAASAEVSDFSGVWLIDHDEPQVRTLGGAPPPLSSWARELYDKHLAARRSGDIAFDTTESTCASPGMPRVLYLPYPFEVVQSAREIVFVLGWNHLYRRIAIDPTGTRHPVALYPTAMGTGLGHWEGSTLVIETVGRTDMTLLDEDLPNSDALHVSEHIAVKDQGRVLEDRMTIEDPKAFTTAWEAVVRFHRLPHVQIHEDVCVERIRQGGPAIVHAKNAS